MNIDKNEMTLAYIHKDEPKYFTQFIGFIDQIGTSCVRKLKIDPLYQDDVKQIAVEHAYRKMDHYDPNSGSAAYSFFYKVILRRCLYELRDMNKKKTRMPVMCSLDTVLNTYKDDSTSDEITNLEDTLAYNPEDDSSVVMINGVPYSRSYSINKIREAKTIVRHEKLIIKNECLFSLKMNDFYSINDDFLSMVCVQILENKEKKVRRLQRSKG